MDKISLIFAMQAEADPVLAKLDLKKIQPDPFYQALPFGFYQGVFRDRLQLSVTIPGKDRRFAVDSIGTEPAAVAAFATIFHFRPQVLINSGTAGGFQGKGAEVGKVYLSDRHFAFHDHRIPLPGWDRFGQGMYPSADVSRLAAKLGLERANISSGNSLDFTDDELLRIEANQASLKEMEAAAIAWVAYTTHTPVFAIKSVTNLIDTNPDSPAEFEKNFALASSAMARETLRALDLFVEFGVGELVRVAEL
jgi:nucleoside phosphorylase